MGAGPSPPLTVYGPTKFGGLLGGYLNDDVYHLPAAGGAAKIHDLPNTAMNPTFSGTTWMGSVVTNDGRS